MKGKTLRSNKGITLVALVVTIIVLLILAGVSINLVIGENGIINRSKEATKSYDKAAVEEEVDMAIAQISMDHSGAASVDDIYNALNVNATTKLLKGDVDNLANNGTSVSFDYKGYGFEVDANLNIGNNGSLAGALPSSFGFSVSPDQENPGATTVTITLSIGNPSDGTIANIEAPSGATQVASNNGQTKLASMNPMSAENTYKYEVTANGAYKFTAVTSQGRKQTKTVNVNSVAETEIFSSAYTETKVERDSQGKQYVVPKDFKVGISNKINRVDSGLVIEGPEGSQWVWIPVNNISEMMNYVPKGQEVASRGKLYNFAWDGQLYIGLNTANKEVEEPGWIESWSIVLDNYESGNTYEELKNKFKTQLSNEYADMAESVNKYKGFYIARFEAAVGDGGALYSQKGQPVAAEKTWESLYKGAKTTYKLYSTYDSINTGMIWGSQWDQTMKYLKDVSKTVDEGSLSIMRYASTEATTNTGLESINNIFDIAGHKGEYTIETQDTGDNVYQWVYRGGTYPSGRVSGRFHTSNASITRNIGVSTRMQLYVK